MNEIRDAMTLLEWFLYGMLVVYTVGQAGIIAYLFWQDWRHR